jgi:hypothetical protein
MSRRDDLEQQAALAVEAQIRAGEKRDRGELRYLADDHDCPDHMRLAALGEEFGEACRALHDDDPEGLALELTQLAGVALAWGVALTYTP